MPSSFGLGFVRNVLLFLYFVLPFVGVVDIFWVVVILELVTGNCGVEADYFAPELMDQGTIIDDKEAVRIELVKSPSDKHVDLLRPSARNSAASKGQAADDSGRERGKYTPLLQDTEDSQAGFYDKPLPCFGCGIGWFSFLLGFLFPLLWFYAAILYFGNHYRKDPRERAGLAAAAVAAMACSVILLIVLACYILR